MQREGIGPQKLSYAIDLFKCPIRRIDDGNNGVVNIVQTFENYDCFN